MNTGCPRPAVRDTALQLLQLLDKRFFGPTIVPATEEESMFFNGIMELKN